MFGEDQAENDVLVNGGVEIGPQLVGGGPQPRVERREKSQGIGGRIFQRNLKNFTTALGRTDLYGITLVEATREVQQFIHNPPLL